MILFIFLLACFLTRLRSDRKKVTSLPLCCIISIATFCVLPFCLLSHQPHRNQHLHQLTTMAMNTRVKYADEIGKTAVPSYITGEDTRSTSRKEITPQGQARLHLNKQTNSTAALSSYRQCTSSQQTTTSISETMERSETAAVLLILVS